MTEVWEGSCAQPEFKRWGWMRFWAGVTLDALTDGLRALTPHWELCTWEGCLPGGFDAAMRCADESMVTRKHYLARYGEPDWGLADWDVHWYDGFKERRELTRADVLATDWHVWVEREWVGS